MSTSSAVFGPLFLALLLTQAANVALADTSAEVGKKHFITYCSSCHGTDARGGGVAAPGLSTAPPNLREIAKRRDGAFPIEEISAKIDGRDTPPIHGAPEMPVWGRTFSDRLGGGTLGEEAVRGELHVLIKYLQSIQE